MLDNVKTWQVGILTFLFCTIVGIPIGILYLKRLLKQEKRPNVNKMRKAYEREYSKWV